MFGSRGGGVEKSRDVLCSISEDPGTQLAFIGPRWNDSSSEGGRLKEALPSTGSLQPACPLACILEYNLTLWETPCEGRFAYKGAFG